MDNSGYIALNRQSGLLAEMQAVANNIANASTTGFRREGVVFSEFLGETGPGQEPISMAAARARHVDLSQGDLVKTGGTFDFAIDGEGFFLVETTDGGQGMTRSGVFSTNANAELVTMEGLRVLDAGGAPVFVPPDARAVALAQDGTISVDGRAVGQLGLWTPAEPTDLIHEAGTLFRAEGDLVPVENGKMVQGFIEGSNVNPVLEVARMIEVSRAYELGQTFLDKEDDRIRNVVRTLGS